MDLTQLREEIDRIDDGLAQLFARRMEAVRLVAEHKKQEGLPLRDSARERAVVSRVADIVGPEHAAQVKLLFNTLFDISRSRQSRVLNGTSPLVTQVRAAAKDTSRTFPAKAVVACQGAEGAYSQLACDKLFSLPDTLYFSSFEGVFQAVASGLCQYGILPLENSSAGSVTAVYDLMRRYDARIARSVKLKIDHALMAQKGVKLADIREVISHEQALSQCGGFFRQHPEIKATVYENTATAARFVAQSGRRDAAAIAAPVCAQVYGLSLLPERVQDTDHNYTRFICISRELEIYPGANKISMMLTLPHRPGSLYALVSRFAALGLNLTKLESRPIPGRDFEFMFYFDVEASVYAEETAALLAELESDLESFTFLGSYSEVN